MIYWNRNNRKEWKLMLLAVVFLVACKSENSKELKLANYQLKLELDDNRIMLSSLASSNGAWQLNADSVNELLSLTKYNSNGSIVSKVFSHEFKLLKIQWFDSNGWYAKNTFVPELGTYMYEYSADFSLDSSLVYASVVIPYQNRYQKIVMISNDFIPIQSVFPAAEVKNSIRYDLANNTIYMEIDTAFQEESIILTYSVLVGNDFHEFKQPIIVHWPND